MANTQVIERPKRWDVPFWQEGSGTVRCAPMDDSLIDKLMQVRPFRSMKQSQRLRDLLLNDCRVRLFEDREVIVRQGDYGNSAFLILAGEAKILKDVSRAQMGESVHKKRSLLRSLTQRLTNARVQESRDTSNYPQLERAGTTDPRNPMATDVPISKVSEAYCNQPGAVTLQRASMFGELAALGRLPRAATIVSSGETKMLEVRWQGLRDIRNYDDGFKQQIDENYRQFGLTSTLEESPLLSFLKKPEHAELSKQIARDAVFETYGRFDWHGTYQQLRQRQADPLTEEPIICRAGEVPNGLIFIRAGFARLSRPLGSGERTISYLHKGDTCGLAELAYNADSGQHIPMAATLRAVGYVDVVRIPTRTFEKLILPHLPNSSIPDLPPEAKPAPSSDVSLPVLSRGMAKPDPGTKQGVSPGMLEFLVENRYINGTATMVIDLDRCTRCDDCVSACASGHNNNPRFVRHGRVYDHFMVANACMHCEDPVCMIGCPTGAIHRTEKTGEVVINDNTCIGCSMCADSCPYENIRMTPIRNRAQGNAVMIGPGTGKPIIKATKCDLCVEHHGGPACQRACPHDALQRLNIGDLPELARRLNR